MSELHIAVRLEVKDDKLPATAQVRSHIGTIYFQEGTTANTVCKRIMERQKTITGLWLLQVAVNTPSIYPRGQVEDGAFVTVKDSKHRLEDGAKYVAVYYNGPPVFMDIA